MKNSIFISYSRLSRDEDGSDYSSIQEQHNISTRFIKEKLNHNGKILYFSDDNYSGYNFDRPDYQKMRKLIINTKENVIFISKDLSRFSRNQALLLLEYDFFYELDIRMIFINENIDSLLRPDIRNILGIYAWEKESAIRAASNSVTQNFRERQKNGDLIIQVPVGYILKSEQYTNHRGRIKKRNFEILVDENYKHIIQKIFYYYINGMGYRRIAEFMTQKGYPTPSAYKNHLNASSIWSNQIVSKIIKNDFYIGVLTSFKTYKKSIKGKSYVNPKEKQIKHENNHEPIIDKHTFDLAQKIRDERCNRNIRGNKGLYINLFAGKILCGNCGKYYVCLKYNKKNKARTTYVCGTKHRYSKKYCSNKNIAEEDLVNIIKDFIKEKIKENNSIYEMLKDKTKNINNDLDINKEINSLETNIKKKKIYIERIYEDKLKEEDENLGIIPIEILNRQLKKATSELYNMEEKLEELVKIKNRSQDQVNNIEIQNEFLNNFLEINLAKKEIDELIDKIIIYDSKGKKEREIEIYLNI